MSPQAIVPAPVSHLLSPVRTRALALAAAAAVAVPFGSAAPASAHHGGAAYVETDLVSDVPGMTPLTDAHLKNPWGVSFGPTTPIWVANNGTSTSTLYRGANATGPISQVPLVVPTPPGPTGTVFNSTSEFPLADGTTGRFLFDDLSGHLSAWAPGKPAAEIRATVPGASFTGLALAVTRRGPRLYAADNGPAAIVRIFDGNFHEIGHLRSTGLPMGFAPYNVRVLDDRLYVTYAPPDSSTTSVRGAVDVFRLNGQFVRHLVIGGALSGPWGLAIAPRHWGQFSRDLLVGNEDGGMINAFNPRTGQFKGALRDRSGMPIQHDGLWSIAFGNGVIANPNTLVMVAGIDDYQHGLLATITPAEGRDAD